MSTAHRTALDRLIKEALRALGIREARIEQLEEYAYDDGRTLAEMVRYILDNYASASEIFDDRIVR